MGGSEGFCVLLVALFTIHKIKARRERTKVRGEQSPMMLFVSVSAFPFSARLRAQCNGQVEELVNKEDSSVVHSYVSTGILVLLMYAFFYKTCFFFFFLYKIYLRCFTLLSSPFALVCNIIFTLVSLQRLSARYLFLLVIFT